MAVDTAIEPASPGMAGQTARSDDRAVPIPPIPEDAVQSPGSLPCRSHFANE